MNVYVADPKYCFEVSVPVDFIESFDHNMVRIDDNNTHPFPKNLVDLYYDGNVVFFSFTIGDAKWWYFFGELVNAVEEFLSFYDYDDPIGVFANDSFDFVLEDASVAGTRMVHLLTDPANKEDFQNNPNYNTLLEAARKFAEVE